MFLTNNRLLLVCIHWEVGPLALGRACDEFRIIGTHRKEIGKSLKSGCPIGSDSKGIDALGGRTTGLGVGASVPRDVGANGQPQTVYVPCKPLAGIALDGLRGAACCLGLSN